MTYWLDLKQYKPQEDLRKSLKMLNRQYQFAVKHQTALNNNLITQLDLTFPGINKLFTSPAKNQNGHLKWVDFVLEFPHCDKIAKLTPSAFKRNISTGVRKMAIVIVVAKLMKSILLQEKLSVQSRLMTLFF